MSQKRKNDDLYVVIISTLEERNQLHDLCVKHNVPILYPDFFVEKQIHHLWGISKTGVGLVGTAVAMNTKKTNVLHSIIELEKVSESW